MSTVALPRPRLLHLSRLVPGLLAVLACSPADDPPEPMPDVSSRTAVVPHESPATGDARRAGSLPADRILVDGSSTVFPITEAVAVEFERLAPGVTIRLGVSGTGGGFRRFCRGGTDLSDASRPIKDAEAAVCREHGIAFVELPVAYDGITVVVPASNDFARCLGVEELRSLWRPEAEGEIVRWSQLREGWPDLSIRLYGAGRDSGTFDYFTEAIVGTEGVSRDDFTASEDDYLIAQDVARDPSALGFFGLAYAREYRDRLRPVAVDAGAGCVAPDDDAIGDGTYVPLSRPIFVYVSVAALERPAVRAFAEFYLQNAPRVVPDVGYVALPARAYDLALGRLRAGLTGSVFGGQSRVGLPVERLLEMEARALRAAEREDPAQ